jgi:hypothetical protein
LSRIFTECEMMTCGLAMEFSNCLIWETIGGVKSLYFWMFEFELETEKLMCSLPCIRLEKDTLKNLLHLTNLPLLFNFALFTVFSELYVAHTMSSQVIKSNRTKHSQKKID